MVKIDKVIELILKGTSDTNINFNDLRNILIRYGFTERIRGSHHIFTKEGVDEIIIYWSKDDNSFIVEVPELPGCMADGSTYHEAISNVEVVIKEWIETAKELGRQIPEPKGKLMYA